MLYQRLICGWEVAVTVAEGAAAKVRTINHYYYSTRVKGVGYSPRPLLQESSPRLKSCAPILNITIYYNRYFSCKIKYAHNKYLLISSHIV